MTTYAELLKDPIKNREQLLAMDRAVEHMTVSDYKRYTSSINGLEINQDTPLFEIYNHIGIPSEPYVIHTHKRLPRKLKKHIKVNRGVIMQLFGFNHQ